MTVTCRPYKLKKKSHWEFRGSYIDVIPRCGRKVVIAVSEGPLTHTFWLECVKSISFLPQTLTPIYHATCSEPGTYQNQSRQFTIELSG